MSKTRSTFLALLAVLLSPMAANADLIELNGGGAATQGFGPGEGRAIGVVVEESFTLTSIGFFGELLSESFDAVLYGSTNGSDTTGVLASSSTLFGGGGLGWNDISLGFDLIAGSFYVFHFRPSDGGSNDWLGANGYEFFQDSGLPVDVGPLTVLDGAEGGFGGLNFGNTVHARMRISTASVPEPGTLALLGIGLAGMGLARRRRKV